MVAGNNKTVKDIALISCPVSPLVHTGSLKRETPSPQLCIPDSLQIFNEDLMTIFKNVGQNQ